MDIEKYIEVTPVQQLIFSQKASSSQTLCTDNLEQICYKISQIKNVKVGKKRQLKLVQQNAKKLGQVSNSRYTSRRAALDLSQPSMYESGSTTVTKKKKIAKKNKGGKIRKNESINDEKIFDEKQWDKTIESQRFEEEAKNQNILGSNHKGLKTQGNILEGGIGHCTLIFEQEIIQGSYYLEFKILQARENQSYMNKPNVRIGACSRYHKLDTPLGYADSIGLSLNRSCLFTQGKRYGPELEAYPIKNGDIVGLLLEFSPPYRNPDIHKKWEDSSISYFVNGKPVLKFEELKQMFYHPAISLYNGARVSIRTKVQQMTYMPEFCLAYQKISQYTNIYN